MAIRTAVIGAGAMGRAHARLVGKVPGVELVAVVDPSEEAARRAAEEAHAGTPYADMEPMLAEQQPDYVVVASPARHHAAQSIAAFRAGAHVLCEKPLCMDMAEANAMVEAGQRAGRLFTMGFPQRQSRAYRALREFIAAGKLGRLYHTRVWGGHTMRYPWGRFHHRAEESFGGVMAATVVHELDAALWVIGSPDPVTVSASTFRRLDLRPDPPIHFEGTIDEVTVEDFGHAHVRFADGSSMSIEGNWLMHPCGHGAGFEVNGVLGVARNNRTEVELEQGDKVVPLALEPEAQPEDWTLAEHQEFVDAIQGRGEPVVRYRQALAVQRILVGIYESAQRGAEVRV